MTSTMTCRDRFILHANGVRSWRLPGFAISAQFLLLFELVRGRSWKTREEVLQRIPERGWSSEDNWHAWVQQKRVRPPVQELLRSKCFQRWRATNLINLKKTLFRMLTDRTKVRYEIDENVKKLKLLSKRCKPTKSSYVNLSKFVHFISQFITSHRNST